MLATDAPKRGQIRATTVAIVSCVFLVVAASMSALVATAVAALVETADTIDDQRSLNATQGAIEALRRQLAATVRDNAYWDDAYEQTRGTDREAWILETWGEMTADYPLYDTVAVIDPARKAVIFYHDGEKLPNPFTFFDHSLEALLAAAVKREARETLPVAFLETQHGMMIVGAAAIQPFRADHGLDPGSFHLLVFGKELKASVVEQISRDYSIKGLSLDRSPSSTSLHLPLPAPQGRTSGFFSWPPQHPGTLGFVEVRHYLAAAIAILVLFLGGIVWAGAAVIENLRRQKSDAMFKATHDSLTGLWNRAGFIERLTQTLAKKDRVPAVLHLVDLDGFKVVNDTYGHPVGDELLRAVAVRLSDLLPSGAYLARLGGDEFAALAAEPCGHQMVEVLRRPFHLHGRTIEIGGSVGISQSEEAELSTTEMVRRADVALYRAKALGRGTTVRFSPEFDREEIADQTLENDLRIALKNRDMSVLFQPLIDVASRRMIGVEALARWHHPTRGQVPPDLFVRVAEKSGLIDQLGCQILEIAVEAASDWPDLALSINVSPIQLRNPHAVHEIERILKAANFDASRLTIEVTEGVFIANPDQAKRVFAGLQAIGIKIALDDFGSGYASIGALREYNFDCMKIDRSITSNLQGNGPAILQATMALAKALDVPVTAEGIETEEQAAILRLLGCDEFQGYLFGRPLRKEEISNRISSSAKGMAS
jgi:diguanylate cyclase (GGDEF)-like protein